MVNQDPQPEIFETVHTFDYTGGDIAANTMRSVDVFTYQANNEEFRLYAIKVEMLGTVDYGGAAAGVELSCCSVLPAQNTGLAPVAADMVFSPDNAGAPSFGGMDFNIGIRVGGQLVPSTTFDASSIFCKDDKTLAFACPVIVLFKQPFQIEVSNATQLSTLATYGIRTVKVTLIGEIGIQKQY
tara:strand:+ start:350 stop:901 length:552 start_codon:yes stop_codon:yes gene_type:complete